MKSGIIFSLAFIALYLRSYAQCPLGTSYGAANAPAYSGIQVIANAVDGPCHFSNDYATFSGLTIGRSYTTGTCTGVGGSTSGSGTTLGNVITLRDGAGNLLSSGSSNAGGHCLTFTATTTTVLVQVNINNGLCNAVASCSSIGMICNDCTPPPPPANDFCVNATPLTPQANASSCSSPVAATTLGADPVNSNTSCGGVATNDDVWFSFQAGNTSQTVRFENVSATSGIVNGMGMDVYTVCGGTPGACFSAISLVNGSGQATLTNLTTGNNYLLHVWTVGTNNSADFSVCVINPPPAPVELLAFKGETHGTANLLYWQTATEKNVKQYTVERSTDAVQWSTAGIHAALEHGNTRLNEYRWLDEKPLAHAYYRLRTEEFNGNIHISATVEVERLNEGLSLVLASSSPASDHLLVRCNTVEEGKMTIVLLDRAGLFVRKFVQEVPKGTREMSLPVEDLPAGYYMVQAFSDRARTLPLRFIKM